MTATLPAEINLHTTAHGSDPLALEQIGAPSSITTKAAGNLPITGVAAQFLADDPSAVEGLAWDFTGTPIDMSVDTRVLVWAWQFNAPNRIQCQTTANDGVVARLYTSVGNYRQFRLGGNDALAGSSQGGALPFVLDPRASSFSAEVGTYNDASVLGYGFAVRQQDISGTSTCQVFFPRAFLFETIKDGDMPKFVGAGAHFSDLSTLVLGTDYTNKIHTFVARAGETYTLNCPWQIGDNGVTPTTFDDAGATVLSPASNSPSDPRFHLSDDAMRVYTSLGASGVVTLSGTYVWGTAADWDFDSNVGASITLSGTFSGMGDFALGPDVSAPGTFSVDASHAVVDNGANLAGIRVNGRLRVDARTLTNVTADTVEVVTGGALILDGSTVATIENTSGAPVTVSLVGGSSIPALVETSGTLTIANDMVVTFTGLSAGDAVYVEDASQTQQLYVVSAAGADEVLSIPRSADGEAWAYGIGRAGNPTNVGTISVAEGTTLSVAAAFSPYLRAAGTNMYTSSSSADVSITFDLLTPQASVDVGDAEVLPQTVFDELEDAIVGSADGMRWAVREGGVVTHDNLPGVGNILFLQDDIRLRRSAPGDANAALGGYAQSAQGAPVDDTNGSVAFVGGLDTATIAAAVWGALLADHAIAGSFGLATANLDVAVSTRSSHAAPDLTNLDVAVSTRSSHGAPDLTNLDAPVSSRSSHAAPDLSNLDVAVSTRSSHAAPDLTNLDAPVSTRATAADVSSALSTAEPIDANVTQVGGVAVSAPSDLQADVSALATAAELATVDANVDAILVDTDATIPAAISAIPTAPSAADVYAEFTSGSNEDVFKADTAALATAASIAALNDLDATAVETAAQAALTAQGLTPARATALDNLDAAVSTRQSESSASSRAATNQAEHDATQASIGGIAAPPTAAAIADAVADEALAGHASPGTVGEALGRLDAAVSSRSSHVAPDLAPLATSAQVAALPAPLTAAEVNAEVDAALADYDGPTAAELTAAVAPLATSAEVSGLATPLDAAGIRAAVGLASADLDAQLADLPTSAELSTALDAADDATLAAIGTLNDLDSAAVQSATQAALTAQGLTTVRAASLDTVQLIQKYHDNRTLFFDSDGTTETTQSNAYFMTVYDDDGVTALKRVEFRDASDSPVPLSTATRYVRTP